MNYLDQKRSTPPTLIIHGGKDVLVPFNQSCQLYDYMKKLGKNVTFYKIDEADHGCRGFENSTVLRIVLEFLKKNI
jgi:dipeptidyl aminopeptidase/acylaminoacyl peptidase